MRFFTYNATDAKGRPAKGTIQAATLDEARLALVRAGWTVYDVQPAGSQASVPSSPANPQGVSSIQPSVRPQVQASPNQIVLNTPTSSTPNLQASQPATRSAPASRPLANPTPAQGNQNPAAPRSGQAPVLNTQTGGSSPRFKTKRGTDQERFFLFSQLAAAFRSGLNPVTTFSEVASRSRGHFHDSLEALAVTATEGGSLARTMARYPDLYPEHVIGLTEAGQQGGFLPDAFEQISLQAQSAHKFKKWFFWIWLVFMNTLLLLPGMWWTTRSLLKAWEVADAQAGGAGGMNVAVSGFWQTLVWPIGPAFLLLCFFCWATYTYFGSRVAKRFRHRVGLRAPVYGKRARHENLSIFSWALARLSHSGLPPSRAYRLAAETAPNLEMRDELLDLANRLSGAEKMSQIIGGSRLFPDEYVPVIATAEYTGDLPGALQQLSEMSRDEFQTAETYAKMRSGCWGMLAFGVVGGLAMAMLMYTWYHELPEKILKGFEWLHR